MMKYLFLFFSFFLIHQNQACELLSNLALKRMDTHYTYAKSYRIDGRYRKRKKVEYTAVFSKGTHYQFSLAEKMHFQESQLKVSILNRKKRVIFTNEQDGKLSNKINFHIKATNIYYVRFEFTKDIRACGAAVLGFYRFKFKPNQQYELLVEITDKKQQKDLRILYGETNEDLQLKLLFCHREEEWNEIFHADNKSDQELKRYLPPHVQKSHPKLEFKIKEIRPFP